MKRFSIQWLVWLSVAHFSRGDLGCPNNDACLFFTDGNSIKSVNTSINFGVQHTTPYKVLDNIPGSYAIDIDAKAKMIFWSEQNPSWKIRSISLETGQVKDIIEGVGEVKGIAVDPVHRNIYWTDYTYEKIEVASYDGLTRKTLYNSSSVMPNNNIRVMYNPTAIVVHPTKGYLFWVDAHYYVYFGLVNYQEIARSTLAGTEYKTVKLLYGTALHYNYPLRLAIDALADRLYYYNSVASELSSTDLNGGNTIKHHVSGHESIASDLVFSGNFLYWTSKKSHSIERVQAGSWRRMISFGWLSDGRLLGIAAYRSSDKKNVTTACTLSNGNCSHLCLLTPTGKKCACANGVDLLSDNVTCSNETHAVAPSKPPELQARLVNGRYPSEGRVEIRYLNVWGTICDDNFDITEAHVVCRMLNYSRAITFLTSWSEFGQGSPSSLIFLDQVKCRGDEASLAYCNHAGWLRHDCRHSEDIAVKCFNGTDHEPENPYNNATDLVIELHGGQHPWEGRVEVRSAGIWGTICDPAWTLNDANVVCRMLGYRGAWGAQGGAYFGRGSGKIWTSNVLCNGSESSIGLCPSAGWGSPLCKHDHDVSVTCKHNISSESKTIRLRGGLGQSEGYVEINHNGKWGWFCDYGWDLKSANVACRQLGFPSAFKALKGGTYGKGYGPSILAKVQCLGNESSLTNCSLSTGSFTSCRTAGVICKANEQLVLKNLSSFLLVADKKRGMLYQVVRGPGDNKTLSIPFPVNMSDPDVLAVNPLNRVVFIVFRYSGIYSLDIFTGESKLIIKERSFIYSATLDHVCKKLYWTLFFKGAIMVSDLDGSKAKVLIEVDYPAGVALDVKSGLMYYLGDNYQSLYQAYMDGSHRKKVISLPQNSQAYSLILEKANNILYWINKGKIHYLNMSSISSGIQTLDSDHVYHPYELTNYGDHVYWTERNSGRYTGGLYRSRWIASEQKHVTELVFTGLLDPAGVSSIGNEIVPENTACKSCACPSCYRIPSGHQCNCSGINIFNSTTNKCILPDYLVFVDYYYERATILAEDPKLRGRTQDIQLQKSYTPHYVECDPVEQRLYYGDIYEKMVARIFINGSAEEVIVKDIQPSGLSIDHIGRNLYFTDQKNSSIIVCKLDGSSKKTLISIPSRKLSSIAVNSKTGYMYWGFTSKDAGDKYVGIGRAFMDGTNEITLFKWYSADHYGPSQLTIDQSHNRLYWVGWHDSFVEYIHLGPQETTPTRVQIYGAHSQYLYMPNGIATTNTTIYWTDEFEGVLVSGDHQGQGKPSLLATNRYSIAGLQFCKGGLNLPPESPCSGQCSYLCLVTPSGSYCACPDNSPSNSSCHKTFPTTTAPPPTTTPPPTTLPPTTTPSPTTTSLPTTIPTPPPSEFDGTCNPNPCENGGICKTDNTGSAYSCKCPNFYIPPESCSTNAGGGVCIFIIEREVPEELMWEILYTIQNVLSTPGLEWENSRKRRAVQPTSNITVYSVAPPDRSTPNRTELQIVAVKKTEDGKIIEDNVLPAKKLETNIKKKKSEFEDAFLKTFKKEMPIADVKAFPKSKTSRSTSKKPGGVIALAVIIPLLLLIALGAILFVFVLRPRKVTGRYKFKNEQRGGQSDLTTFSNPGYGAEAPIDGAIAMSGVNSASKEMTAADNPTYVSTEEIQFTEKSPAANPRPENIYETAGEKADTVLGKDSGNVYENPQYISPKQTTEWEKFDDNVPEGKLTLDQSHQPDA